MKVLARIAKCEMGNLEDLLAEFLLALGFERVVGFVRWARRHPSFRVVDFFPRSIIRVPYVGQLDDCCWSVDRFERAHRVLDDPPLQFRLMRRTGLMAQRKIYEHRARWLDRPRDV